jgi:glycerophosphoryl diester phosphodiesterase
MGVDVLEMDAHMTSDGQIVLMHDDLVDRTTNGTGLVSDHTLAEIKALEVAGNWTQDDGAAYPYQGQGLQVPTVAEVFERFPDYPMIIEIKQDSPDMTGPFCDLIRQYDMAEKVLVPSFDDNTIKAFRAACPEVATASASNETRAFVIAGFLQATNLLTPAFQAMQVPESSGGIPVVIAPFVTNAHRYNLQVHVWTINDPADMERLIQMGVDGIMTDRPDLLIPLLGR